MRSTSLCAIDSVVGQKLSEDSWGNAKGFVQPTAELQKLRFSQLMSFFRGPHLIPAVGGRTTWFRDGSVRKRVGYKQQALR